MYGNRACITDQIVEEFGAELRAWVKENCERSIDGADVWLLPSLPGTELIAS